MLNTLSFLPIPLLQWYGEHARDLPWRREPTPSRVWVSEIMLQQTRVAAVLGYFAKFMDAFPTVQDLAAAPEDQLMKLWQGISHRLWGHPFPGRGGRLYRRGHCLHLLWPACPRGGRQSAAGGRPSDGG